MSDLKPGDWVTLVIYDGSAVPAITYDGRTAKNGANGLVGDLVPENEGIFWLQGIFRRRSDEVKAAVVAQALLR